MKTHNVLVYGADPSGQRDSTEAFRKAVEEWALGSPGQVVVPAGTYRLSGCLCGVHSEESTIEGQEGELI